jgi:putative heptosyltransferase
MQEALRLIEDSQLFELFLFGSRGREQAQIKQWAADRPHVHSVAGQLDLSDELILIASLRAMISMDSANMHLASMVGTRVFSIWCCTHPAAGFLGIGQRFEDCLQPEDAPRRPCSIFGDNKHCHTGPDFACSRALSPERIFQAILTLTESAGS